MAFSLSERKDDAEEEEEEEDDIDMLQNDFEEEEEEEIQWLNGSFSVSAILILSCKYLQTFSSWFVTL